MIIIFGNGPKYYTEAEGKFICPNCNKCCGLAEVLAPTSQIKKCPFFEGINANSAGLLIFLTVPSIKKEEFDLIAEEAKNNCPISGSLNCEINLNASLV